MKNNNNIGQELSEFKPVELVGYEDEEAGNHDTLASMVVHWCEETGFCTLNEIL